MAQKTPLQLLRAIHARMATTSLAVSTAPDVEQESGPRRRSLYSVHMDAASDTGKYRNATRAPGMRLQYTGRIKLMHTPKPSDGKTRDEVPLEDLAAIMVALYEPATDLTTAFDFHVSSWNHRPIGQGEYLLTEVQWRAEFDLTLASS